jgi:hypothetical protein
MAWLPVGPTASEAAEIILLLVVVPFLFSFSLLVWFPTVSLLVAGLYIAAILLFCAPSPREHGYPGQGPTAIAVQPQHKRSILSAFRVTGPWI